MGYAKRRENSAEMTEAEEEPNAIWWKAPLRQWTLLLQNREEQVFLVLTLLIGALVAATWGLVWTKNAACAKQRSTAPSRPPSFAG